MEKLFYDVYLEFRKWFELSPKYYIWDYWYIIQDNKVFLTVYNHKDYDIFSDLYWKHF